MKKQIKGAAVNRLFEPHYFIDQNLFATKKGAIGVVLEGQGIDYECLDDSRTEDCTRQIHAEFRNVDASFRIYQHVVKTRGAAVVYHRAAELFTFRTFRTLLLEPKSMHQGMPTIGGLKLSEEELEKQKQDIYSVVQSMQKSPMGTLAGFRLLDHNGVFEFLKLLSGGSETEHYTDHLDYWMAPKYIGVHRKQVSIDNFEQVSLSLRELPRFTNAAMLPALLRLDCEIVLCTEWKRIDGQRANEIISDKQDHFSFSKKFKNKKAAIKEGIKKDGNQDTPVDQSAVESISELGELQKRINNSGEFFGEFALSLILRGTSYSQLYPVAAEAINIVGSMEGKLALDTIGSLETYLATIPGNTSSQFRRFLMPSMSYADLALVYAPPVGDRINKHLGKEALTILETTFHTAYDFNLYEGDLLGALLFGIMGVGKSFLTNLLIDKAQKYKPFTFILDIGNSYRHLTAKHGGSYIELAKRSQKFTINPFDCEKNAENLEFLSSFVHVLLGTSGYEPHPAECREIDAAVKKATRLNDLDVSPSIRERLYNWIGEGRYAFLFDNPTDTLSLSDFQTFDLQGVNQKLLEPLFFYIFNRISQIVYDPKNRHRPKQLFSDEAWKFLSTPSARDYFIEAGKTWRKHNGGICLITQSALDLERAGLLDCINEICPTKILLANPGANKAHYKQIFELNDKEVELFSDLTPKKQLLLKTPQRSAVLSVMPSREEYWTYANDPNSNRIREEQGMEALTKGVAA